MRKIIAFVVCAILMAQSIPAYAYSYPSGFWSVNLKYETAINSGNHSQIIEYGNQIVKLMQSSGDSAEKRNILVTRYNQLGCSYAAIGDYDNAAKMFQRLYDYAKQYGDEFYDYVKSAEVKKDQYAQDIRLYTDGGQYTYYGAVNEKQNGVLFGMCANGATRSKLGNESMVLTYQELGQELLAYNVSILQKAASEGIAVEFALNCPKEATDIKNIKRMDSYLAQISNLFQKYPSTPIYLRFAAEFDIWSNLAEADEYIDAFRYVSNYFKNRNSNVAMVWSPNQVSNWYVDIDDYYPGDSYVDWVGISLYAQKYFLGDPGQDKENELIFKAGINSNPVVAVKEIVETYGNRKPIMISESGCGHKLVKSGEDTSDFALQRLKEYMSYLPMVYPQIKLIAYFDWHVESDKEKNDFRLSNNSTLQNEYLRLVKGQRFIQDKYSNNTDFCYRQISDGTSLESIFEVSCYAYMHGAAVKSVAYFIDDKYVDKSVKIPYTATISATEYSGRHKLKAIATFDNGKTIETVSEVNINNTNKKISVEIDDREIYFDQEPIIYNDRTMVPMRKIFEELGADVKWDSGALTASGEKGGREVKVTIGQKTMYVNNTEVSLDTAPLVLSGRTLVPARAVAEGLGCEVEWDGVNDIVEITPKVFSWSEWDEYIPQYVDEDLYYIEEKTEVRVRTRKEEYFYLDHKTYGANYVDKEVSYGEWSQWGNDRVYSSDTLEVQTRTQSSPKQYFYAHYCTGNESDQSIRYKTGNYEFSNACSYHSLGWYDYLLPVAENGNGYILYKDNGDKYRCSNTCYRWYLFEESGGEYTQYRSRPIYTRYIYSQWGDWSRWSDWAEGSADYYDLYDNSIDVEERVIYRYKEKG